jgi:uroporphyrinogen-III synthase
MAVQTGPFVVLTRSVYDNRELADRLERRGVPVLEIPCVAIRPVMPDSVPERADVVVFTSRNGVAGFVAQGLSGKMLSRSDASPRPRDRPPLVGAVGRNTSAKLAEAGIEADFVADPPEGETLARLMIGRLEPNRTIAVVRGNLRAGKLDEMLAAAGHRLVPIQVYENVSPQVPSVDPVAVTAVFVASPSAGRRLLEKNGWLRSARFLVIGKTTEESLLAMGVGSVETIGSTLTDWVEALCGAHLRAVGSQE